MNRRLKEGLFVRLLRLALRAIPTKQELSLSYGQTPQNPLVLKHQNIIELLVNINYEIDKVYHEEDEYWTAFPSWACNLFKTRVGDADINLEYFTITHLRVGIYRCDHLVQETCNGQRIWHVPFGCGDNMGMVYITPGD
jgi:hypothetical protein